MSEPKNPNDESYDPTTCEPQGAQTPAPETSPEAPGTPPEAPEEEPLTAEQTAVIDTLVKYRATKKKAAALIRHFGLTGVEDLQMLEEDELVQCGGLTKIQARKLLNSFKQSPAESAAPAIDEKTAALLDYRSVLMAPPTEEAWLSKLIEGGELKIDEFSIMSAIRALVAEQAGLYQAPSKIMTAINEYVDQMDEPASPAYYRVRTILYRMRRPEIFGLLKADYQFVPREDKNELLGRIHELIPSLKQSFKAVDDWQETLAAAYGGQGAVIAAFNSATGFGGIVIPSIDAVYDASLALRDAINHAFRGRGIQTAKALAADAREITKLLDDPKIPPLVGVSSREQLLRKLGIGIAPNYVRQEENFSMFAQNLLAFSNGYAEGNEFKFLMGLWTLGRTLSWKLLSGVDVFTAEDEEDELPFERGSAGGRAEPEDEPKPTVAKSATDATDYSQGWL